ncbi:EAL domain-containing protein [Vibrio sp. PP-XX7]
MKSQSIINPRLIPDTQMVSIEALARWHNPRMGDIPPQKFINAAEETGHIKELGLFVFRQACEDIYRLSPNSEDALRLSINAPPNKLWSLI